MIFINKLRLVLLILCFNGFVFSQNDMMINEKNLDIKTLSISSENYEVEHYFYSKVISKYFKESTEIDYFNDSNKCSRIFIVSSRNDSFNIPSIPLSRIIIDEKNKIIIGLSDYIKNPYHIVVFNLNGKLLFKKKIELMELKLTFSDLQKFKIQFSELYDCIVRKNYIFKEDEFYYINLFGCKDSEKIRELYLNKIFYNHLLKNTSQSTSIPYSGLKTFSNLFSFSDPYYDFIKSEKLSSFILILNSGSGEHIRIPIPDHIWSDN